MTQIGKRILPASLAFICGALVVLPAIILGVPHNNDLAIHYHYAMPFYEALRHGNLYPGWLGTVNFGYGDDAVRFYPPALYYLLAAGRMIAGSWYAGGLLAMTCVSAVGSLGAYFWARCYLPRNLAVVAGLLYALMPYHLAEFYQAAQLAEFAAGAALLFALAFTKRICDDGRWRDAAGLAAAYAALVLSHLPLAVFGSITLALYALMNVRKHRLSASFFKLASAALIGLAASSFYWVTMVAELKWIRGDGPNPDPLVDYRHSFVFSTFSPEKQETIWWMGLLAITTILMTIPAVGAFVKDRKHKRNLICIAVLLLFSFLMSTEVSKPLWDAIPYLRMTQHPFRWLAVCSVLAPILIAASLPFWLQQFRHRGRPLALTMSGLLLIAITFSLSQTVRGARYLSPATFEHMLAPLKDGPGTVMWLPIWAGQSAQNKASYEKCEPPPGTFAKVEAGARAISVIKWDDTQRSFLVDAGAPVEARVATFYYPHWVATANGNGLQTHPAPDGALLIDVPADAVIVNLEFHEPSRTKIADIASIFSWTLVASVLILGTLASARRDHEPIAN